ncbi:uncharacterized protein LOC127835591 [Dreissena polymorpha]|uniref:uncharacterized protein LOC127835591 n=1 Tax=Dreissena polymorpha TaxID=45954 RepID=UPI002263D487|nr:uncharacterized protein LOC127835591 [Dreissena polymorpha]
MTESAIWISLFIFRICVHATTSDPCLDAEHVVLTNLGSRNDQCLVEDMPINQRLCDHHLETQWYKAEGAVLRTSAPVIENCGVLASAWLNDSLPIESDGVDNRTICIREESNNCVMEYSIEIKNCGSFFVYKLLPFPEEFNCPAAYCFDSTFPCLTSTTTSRKTENANESTTTRLTTTTTTTNQPLQDHKAISWKAIVGICVCVCVVIAFICVCCVIAVRWRVKRLAYDGAKMAHGSQTKSRASVKEHLCLTIENHVAFISLPNPDATSRIQSIKKSKLDIYKECTLGSSLVYQPDSPFGHNIPRPSTVKHDEVYEEITATQYLERQRSARMTYKGIDFTESNQNQGRRTFGGHNLHHLSKPKPNPYQQVISILGETMESFNDDGSIPVFGFGDFETKNSKVFTFLSKGYCSGFREVLSAYESVVGRVSLSGPTNFAPIINIAIRIVELTRLFHTLVIVSDGQKVSEQATRDAIVEASNWPLSIILVGVGDGPWTQMQEYEDSFPTRKFDNFQFVHFESRFPIAKFAFSALMKIPDQYKRIKELGLLKFSNTELDIDNGFTRYF